MPRPTKKCEWVLWATLVIPLNRLTPEWHIPSYSNLKPNQVSLGAKGLKIDVIDSASPLFYALPKSESIKSISIKGKLSNFPFSANPLKSGPIPDDCPLRVGLVETIRGGSNWIEKLISPRWIKDLVELFPEQTIKKVTFLTLDPYRDEGTLRKHPKSQLIEERVVLSPKKSGPFQIYHPFENPLVAQAIWIQSDGDDTHSRFTVEIESLSLETKN